MATKCPKCHYDNPSDSKFCKECGTQLIITEEIPPSPTETLQTPKKELIRGTTFAGRYEIIEELGKGGMGKVYRAEDTKIQEEVALKLIKPEIAADKKTIERFSNELKMARKIAHRNVCKMYELMEDKGTHFITMEYVPGEDLKSMIRMSKQLSVATAIDIAKQVCEGLSEAHRLGVVHRDLKPSNIMIDREGSARIMDFGIARSLKAKGITGAGVMIGTPEYMSPEQVEGKEVDQRSDIYTLGVILYEMVAGRVPFEGDTPFTIGVKHKSEIPKDPRVLNAQIPEDLSRVILRCLEKERDKRYQSAGEVRSVLMNIEKGIPTTERVVPKRKPITSREITVTFGMRKLFIPVLIFIAVGVIGVITWRFALRKEAVPLTAVKRSIAVLPLVDLSPQKDQGYFCDGMTEAIIEKLSQISGLKVSSRTSVMRYKNTDKDIKEISKELGVTTVLEGSVQKEEDNIRIHTQLINVEDNFHIWSDHYDRKLTSIFAIQSDIAQQIAKVLHAKLSPEEKERIAKKPTESLSAYDYYLKGREYYVNYRRKDNEHAIELFKKALEFDPNFALAYSGLGDSYAQRTNKFGFPPKWLDESIEVSQKAISLDSDLSEGYKALGLAYNAKGWLRKSIEANRKAIEFNPNNEQATGNLGWAYYFMGDIDRAMLWFKKSLAIAPMFNYCYAQMGRAYFVLDEFTKAEEWFNKALELQPDFLEGLSGLIDCHLAQGKYQQAVEQSQKWLAMAPNSLSALNYAGMVELFIGNYEKAQQYYQKSSEIRFYFENLTALGYIYWKKGQQDESRELFKESLMLSQQEMSQGNEFWRFPYDIAVIHAIQGKKELAYKWLKKAIDAGWRNFRLGLRDPLLENLHEDEKFQKMMAEVKEMVYEMRKRVEESE